MKFASWALLALLFLFLVACGVTSTEQPSGAWSTANKLNFAPSSRTVVPVRVTQFSGSVEKPESLLERGVTRISGRTSALTLDFGYEVAGTLSIDIAGTSDPSETVGIAFTESSLNIGRTSDLSSAWGIDGALYLTVGGSGVYPNPQDKLRGGFRYVTVFLNSDGWIDLQGISVHFSAAPAMENLREYPNYFLSNDDLLNRIWYAGAYTVQLNTIDPHQGRPWPPPAVGWETTL